MQDFVAMGGYAVFVWGSFGAALAVYVWNLWAVRAERTDLLADEDEE